MYFLRQWTSTKRGGGNEPVKNQLIVQDIHLNLLDLVFYLDLHQSVHTHRYRPIHPCTIPWIKQSKSMKMIVELSLITAPRAVPSRLDLAADRPGGRPLAGQRDLLQLDPGPRVVHWTPTVISSVCL